MYTECAACTLNERLQSLLAYARALYVDGVYRSVFSGLRVVFFFSFPFRWLWRAETLVLCLRRAHTTEGRTEQRVGVRESESMRLPYSPQGLTRRLLMTPHEKKLQAETFSKVYCSKWQNLFLANDRHTMHFSFLFLHLIFIFFHFLSHPEENYTV